jgi:hypothetical protein
MRLKAFPSLVALAPLRCPRLALAVDRHAIEVIAPIDTTVAIPPIELINLVFIARYDEAAGARVQLS